MDYVFGTFGIKKNGAPFYDQLKINTYFTGREMTSKTMNALSVSKSDATIRCAIVDLWG